MRHGGTAAVATVLGLFVLGAGVAAFPGEADDAGARERDLERRLGAEVRPFLAKHCFECHAGAEAEGGVSLDRWPDLAAVAKDRPTWRKIAAQLRDDKMPPASKDRPPAAERAALLAWIDGAIEQAECGLVPPDPGRATVRRLNRFEYDRTIRDLLGVDVKAARAFPADDRGYGFDNNADVLTVSPLLIEKLLVAAERAVAAAVVTGDPLEKKLAKADGASLEGSGGAAPQGSPRGIYSPGALHWRRKIAVAGEYVVRVRASGDQAGPEAPKLLLRVDDAQVASFDVKGARNAPATFEKTLQLKAGDRRLTFAFPNDFYQQGGGPKGENLDRNLYVERVELEGPIGATAEALPEPHRRIFFVMPDKKLPEAEAARRILQRFASRAFRRPVADDEVKRYQALWKAARGRKEAGVGFVEAMLPALHAVLVSPHFLYRIEREPRGTPPGEAYDLPPVELASRLSYFLWSSMPDDALLEAAAAGRLATAAGVEAEAARMLRDKRADALVHGFAAQWLELPSLDAAEPDTKRFPAFTAELKAAMRAETERFIEGIIREDRSILELIDSDYVYVNGTLAEHYGIGGVEGKEWRKVPAKGSGRGGVLAQASILTLTSRPTRTSPVLRGRWLLDEVLGAPPLPAPPGVPPLEDSPEATSARPLRERMARHRTDPACASCHGSMDALGFALEEFDAIGGRRTRDGGFPVDASGELPDGAKVQGLDGLKRWLLERRSQFAKAFARKLMTWALGRGVEDDDDGDRCAVEDVARKIEAGGYKFSAAVRAVAASDPFRRKRAEGPAK